MLPYASVHLPNVIDFNLVYKLIEDEWDGIHDSIKELIVEVAELCQKTSLTLFGKHFKRFSGLLELL